MRLPPLPTAACRALACRRRRKLRWQRAGGGTGGAMFKKNISVSSTHQLSGKDGKELRKSVLKVGAAGQHS